MTHSLSLSLAMQFVHDSFNRLKASHSTELHRPKKMALHVHVEKFKSDPQSRIARLDFVRDPGDLSQEMNVSVVSDIGPIIGAENLSQMDPERTILIDRQAAGTMVSRILDKYLWRMCDGTALKRFLTLHMPKVSRRAPPPPPQLSMAAAGSAT